MAHLKSAYYRAFFGLFVMIAAIIGAFFLAGYIKSTYGAEVGKEGDVKAYEASVAGEADVDIIDAAEIDVACKAVYAARAKEIFDLLRPEYVEFFEKYVVEKPLISGLSERKLIRYMETYRASANKVKVMLMLQSIMQLNGQKVSLSEIASLSDNEYIKIGTDQVNLYIASLSPEKKAALDGEFKKLPLPF